MLALLGSLLSLSLVDTAPAELNAYALRRDSSSAWRVSQRLRERTDIDLTSQSWRGIPWKHLVVVIEPAKLVHKGLAVLVITGGDPNSADLKSAKIVADKSGMPVATLFHVPNQPIWNRKEDDLIAHTFEQFIASGDATWPLLFPMVKSAVRCMDVLVGATAKSRNPLKRFIITGASKRGWTTWLTAATGDKRVAGIAPMVFDNLDFRAQLNHQIASWGKYSEMIADYTDRGLQKILDTPRGSMLLRIVDPLSYLSRITCPTLIVSGANDRYWTVDALSLYWNSLKQRKAAVIVPNAGHDLGDGTKALDALGAFARSCAGEFRFPTVSMRLEERSEGLRFTIQSQNAQPKEVRIWRAGSNTLDFRDSVWQEAVSMLTGVSSPGTTIQALLARPQSNAAYFAEGVFEHKGKRFSLCAPVQVVAKSQG